MLVSGTLDSGPYWVRPYQNVEFIQITSNEANCLARNPIWFHCTLDCNNIYQILIGSPEIDYSLSVALEDNKPMRSLSRISTARRNCWYGCGILFQKFID